MQITPNQIKAIKTLSRIVFHTDEEYREMLSGYGVQSCTALNTLQATQVIKKLSVGVKPQKNGKTVGKGLRKSEAKAGGKVSNHLTQLQADRINILQEVLGWNNTSITQFIQRQTGALKAVQMLMNHEAMKVIVGMQHVLSANFKTDYKLLNDSSNNKLIDLFKLNHKGRYEHTSVSK